MKTMKEWDKIIFGSTFKRKIFEWVISLLIVGLLVYIFFFIVGLFKI